jgi:hypothetical protein
MTTLSQPLCESTPLHGPDHGLGSSQPGELTQKVLLEKSSGPEIKELDGREAFGMPLLVPK